MRKTAQCDITEANILVSGGRGVGCPENFKLLQDFAEAVGGTISSSRACVDAGWVAKDLQVGQTGKTVRPTVYFCTGGRNTAYRRWRNRISLSLSIRMSYLYSKSQTMAKSAIFIKYRPC